ncbi:hypothetical protein MtrunA17_Chr6g0473611 [Medicago truncatula]|uniref:Uncharacterized protein n=1 Tax=Medicago truncatula TaxID=3880 RepID=A0A396HGX9_MEDTR|nr:hypothetical protein MtrunA17_Chr6g0473611 [Medicago truncatula]
MHTGQALFPLEIEPSIPQIRRLSNMYSELKEEEQRKFGATCFFIGN